MIEAFECPAVSNATFAWRFAGPPRRPAGLDVLLIEDDTDIAEMYRRRLAADGLNVALAADATSGIERLRQEPPAVVLLDIRLPDDDGFHVLQALKSDPALARIPVLMLTNYGEPSTVRRALELGAAEYMVKSNTTPAEVSLRVRAYIQGGPAQN